MGVCAGAAVSAAVGDASAAALPVPPAPEADGVPFSLTVMLWTVYRNLPFAQRLEKVAEAGYHAVELVDEFKDWKKEDFAEARRKKRELGIEIDGTCGVWIPLADSTKRDAFLKSLRDFIPAMRELECTRLIMQTGNKIPGLSPEEMHTNCIETLKRGADIAAETKKTSISSPSSTLRTFPAATTPAPVKSTIPTFSASSPNCVIPAMSPWNSIPWAIP